MKHPSPKIVMLVLIAALASLCGCAETRPAAGPTTRLATEIPAEQSHPKYWLDQPDAATITALDYERLWNACADAARQYQFQIDRTDYRSGLLTTKPEISKQFFELWRDDAGTAHDVLRDSVQAIRRTIRFEIQRMPDGAFVAHPKVLVEKLALIQRRITTVSQYQFVFIQPATSETVDFEKNLVVPTRYWYAIGRDEVMEKNLASDIQSKLAKP